MKEVKEYRKEIDNFKHECVTGYRNYQLQSPDFPRNAKLNTSNAGPIAIPRPGNGAWDGALRLARRPEQSARTACADGGLAVEP